MKAIALVPGTTQVALADRPEPVIAAPDEVKIRMEQVGICGTDREQVEGGRADPPPGSRELVIGHEMFGQVVEVGGQVTSVKRGDYGVFTVRRGCGQCAPCRNRRSDLCASGRYTERGIKGADGFQAEYVVDKEAFLVKVPAQIRQLGVLTEPMSVAAKAIDEAVILQKARLGSFEKMDNWLEGKRALVAGIGPIGLMAAIALRLRGCSVLGMDIVDENTLRPRILKALGGTYVDGRRVKTEDLDEACGEADFVFEATGIARLQFDLIDALAINGIYVVTGIPAGSRPVPVQAASLMQQLVLKNQVILGSVNASIDHYRMAVADLQAGSERWPGLLEQVITEHVPFTDFGKALHPHSADEIKVVIDWNQI